MAIEGSVQRYSIDVVSPAPFRLAAHPRYIRAQHRNDIFDFQYTHLLTPPHSRFPETVLLKAVAGLNVHKAES